MSLDNIKKSLEKPIEFIKSVSNKPMTEGKEYDSGLFDRAEEAKVLAENPQLAAGKDLIKAAIENAIGEFDDAQDLMEMMRGKSVYDVINFRGHVYIKTPNKGEIERLPVYINKMERSLIELSKRYSTLSEMAHKQNLELEELREKVKSKPTTKRKRKAK